MIGPWAEAAALNLPGNKRRSLLTILAVAMGDAAVKAFNGFTEYIFRKLKDSFIDAQGIAQLIIPKKGFLDEGQIHSIKSFITKNERGTVRKTSANNPLAMLIMLPREDLGLAGDDEVTTIFMTKSRIPIRCSPYRELRMQDG